MSEDAENTGAFGRDAKGRFALGNPGKPKGARHALSEAFVKALHDDFQEHGADVIATVRQGDPTAYVRVVASLLPKQVEIKEDAFGDLTDEQLSAIIAAARSEIEVHREGGSGAGEEAGEEPPGSVPAVH